MAKKQGFLYPSLLVKLTYAYVTCCPDIGYHVTILSNSALLLLAPYTTLCSNMSHDTFVGPTHWVSFIVSQPLILICHDHPHDSLLAFQVSLTFLFQTCQTNLSVLLILLMQTTFLVAVFAPKLNPLQPHPVQKLSFLLQTLQQRMLNISVPFFLKLLYSREAL